MTVERRTFGKLPVSRNTFVQGTTYYKYNIVMYQGSSFMAKLDGVTAAPTIQYDPETGTFSEDANWMLLSWGGHVAHLEQEVAAKANEEDLLDGTLEVKLAKYADDLSTTSSDLVADIDSFVIRTTAGSQSVLSDQPMHLKNIVGILDDACNPFTATRFRWGRFNQLNTAKFIDNASISASGTTATIASGSNRVYYFKCVRGVWGSYGSASENNGYILSHKSYNATWESYRYIHFWYCDHIPVLGDQVTQITEHTETADDYGDKIYHLPAEIGYICLELPSTVVADFCIHIAWSNKDDRRYEAFVADATSGDNKNVIDFTNPRNSIHNGVGLYGIFSNGQGIYDEIEFDDSVSANRKWYRRVERVLLNTQTWTKNEEGEGESITYHYEATISGFKVNGLIKSAFEGLTVVTDSNKVQYSSTTITTVEDFIELVGDNYLYYELASPASGTHSVSGEGYGDDMSIEEFIASDDASLYPTNQVELDYIQSLKDYLRSLPSKLSDQMQVIAEALNELKADILAINSLQGELGDAHALSLKSDVMYKIGNADLVKVSTDAPSGYPEFIGQIWVDTTNSIAYIAVKLSGNASNDWKRITNA